MVDFNLQEYLSNNWLLEEIKDIELCTGELLSDYLAKISGVVVGIPGDQTYNKEAKPCTCSLEGDKVRVDLEDQTIFIKASDVDKKWVGPSKPNYAKAFDENGNYVLNLWPAPKFSGDASDYVSSVSPEYKKYKPANLHGKHTYLEEDELGEARFISSKNLKYSPGERQAIWKALPDTLYHVTTGGNFKAIKQLGYLGFKYESKKAMSARRGYQPITTGVFLAGSAEAAEAYGGLTFRTNHNIEGKVILSLPKTLLDPEKISLDLDSMIDLMYLDNYSHKTFDLIGILSEFEHQDWFSVFYDGTIKLSEVTVEQDESAAAEEKANKEWERLEKAAKILQSKYGISFDRNTDEGRCKLFSNPLSEKEAASLGMPQGSQLKLFIGFRGEVIVSIEPWDMVNSVDDGTFERIKQEIN